MFSQILGVIILAFFLVGGCQKADDKIEAISPTASDRATYQMLSKRLVNDFTHGGFGVVSRKPDGQPEHLGEALIWGGTALWAIPCDDGRGLSASLASMIDDLEGAMIRVDPLGEYAGGREVTFDGAIGALLGIARRAVDCGEAELWQRPMFKMIKFQSEHGERLHPNVRAMMVGEFRYVRDLIAHRIGVRDLEPSSDRLRELEKIVSGWALAVQASHQTGKGSDACYRVNLGLTGLLAVETLGKSISSEGRDALCQNSKGMDIPTVDHWCGRKPISNYLASYQTDLWEYRHQRCGSWESPDGDGNASHQLDRLVAFVFAHGWQSLQN